MDESGDQDMRKDDSIKAGVQQVVQQLYERDGAVKSSALVEAAKPKSSPAHNGFTWDNAKAAHQYRLVEARNWIRVVVVRPSEDETAERMVHVPIIVESKDAPREGEYKPISVVQANPDDYVRARAGALAAVKAAARALQELDSVATSAGKSDLSAMISQLARGLDMFERAIETMH